MSAQAAFHRAVDPLFQAGSRARRQPDEALRDRIEELATKSTEGDLSAEERAEYEGYVRANKFVAILRREAMALKTQE